MFSEEHKAIGLRESCERPICNSVEYKAIGIVQPCDNPVCNTKVHRAIGLNQECWKPVCNSDDHKEVGLEQECLHICFSDEHNQLGNGTACRKDNYNLFGGRALENAWMHDGDFWNDLQPMSIPRDRAACGLVQGIDGVIF